MITQIDTVKRVFQLTKNGKITELEDLSADLKAEDIKDLYSTQYPELVNATIINKGIENDKVVFEFKTIAGTKG